VLPCVHVVARRLCSGAGTRARLFAAAPRSTGVQSIIQSDHTALVRLVGIDRSVIGSPQVIGTAPALGISIISSARA